MIAIAEHLAPLSFMCESNIRLLVLPDIRLGFFPLFSRILCHLKYFEIINEIISKIRDFYFKVL
jgi:hypothetical protein